MDISTGEELFCMLLWPLSNGGFLGPCATINYEPRQTWKGAAVIVDVCAAVWLFKPPPSFDFFKDYFV